MMHLLCAQPVRGTRDSVLERVTALGYMELYSKLGEVNIMQIIKMTDYSCNTEGLQNLCG